MEKFPLQCNLSQSRRPFVDAVTIGLPVSNGPTNHKATRAMLTFHNFRTSFEHARLRRGCEISLLQLVISKKVMAENNEVRDRIHGLFNKYDKDSVGCLDVAQMTSLIQNDLKEEMDLDENQIETIFMLLDQDGSGKLPFEPFCKWYSSADRLANVKDDFRCRIIQKAVHTFKKFDANKNGTIERDELDRLLKSVSFDAKSRENAFETLDKDKNGKISFPEFICWLKWSEWLPTSD